MNLYGDLAILDGLEQIKDWLELPGDGRPSAMGLAVRVQVETGRQVNYRRMAGLLSAAGITPRRVEGGYGFRGMTCCGRWSRAGLCMRCGSGWIRG